MGVSLTQVREEMEQSRHNTRDRLLEAACEVFAERGFRNATIGEISKCANANIAAVNYHFGDKQTLYAEAWRHAYKVAMEAFPPEGGLGPEAAPEELLRARIRAVVGLIFADGSAGHFGKLMFCEFGVPTGALEELVRETIWPLKERLLRIVSDLLGEDAADDDVLFSAMSVMNQCLAFAFHKKMREHVVGRDNLLSIEVDKLADHIAEFSLAGIRGVRERIAHTKELTPEG